MARRDAIDREIDETRMFEYPIEISYRPTWAAWEGLRELIQNYLDARTQSFGEGSVTYDRTKRSILIKNEGVTLRPEDLLLGHTSKADRSDLIGKFGEGLKIGALALVRAGHSVVIETGAEVWRPAIVESSMVKGSKVLAMMISPRGAYHNDVAVTVSGVSPEAWAEVRSRVLTLDKPSECEAVSAGYRGRLLLAPRYKGRIYVKGIYVCTGKSAFGYDFSNAETDIDRKMVSGVEYYVANMLCNVSEETVLTKIVSLIESGGEESNALEYYSPSTALCAAAVNKFVHDYGTDAVPCDSTAQSAEVGHLGKRGIVVSKCMMKLLASALGVEKLKADLATATVKRYSWCDLSTEEQRCFNDAMELVIIGIDSADKSRVSVVDFVKDGILGLHKGQEVEVARKCLSGGVPHVCGVLLHEFSHDAGGDGEHDHVQALEKAWERVVAFLWGAK